MSIFNDITEATRVVVTTHEGYPPTDAELPYAVTRPLFLGTEGESINGDAIGWDDQYSIYCCGASVEASMNQARLVMAELQGKRIGGTTLSTSMGYSGAPVEGHYESQVTVQLQQGEI